MNPVNHAQLSPQTGQLTVRVNNDVLQSLNALLKQPLHYHVRYLSLPEIYDIERDLNQ